MSQNRDFEALIDIDGYINGRKAVSFVIGQSPDEFEQDEKTIAAVMYAVAIMGEATERLSPDFRALHSDIPWNEIAGMRDRLVHDYKKIDLDILWQVVSFEIPALLNRLTLLLPREFD